MYAIILNLRVKCKYKVEEDFRFALMRDRQLLMIPFKFTCLSIYQEKHPFLCDLGCIKDEMPVGILERKRRDGKTYGT